ncbi:hypothetical protein F5Y19DRAFT_472264 [Xylariaceae sp. FL1651]|nr:hypothetical protein F5Y19DRAFT_472264 [Xylariaceae sp. FL1651]
MKAFISSVVLAVLLGLANAKVQLTNSNYSGIQAGKSFEITWSDAQGPVSLTLKNGPKDDLKTVESITTGATGDSFTWPVDADLPNGMYAIEISDGTDNNYSDMFSITGGVSATSSSASSSSMVSITSSMSSMSSTSSSASSTSTSESSSTESSTVSSTGSSTTTASSTTMTSSTTTTSSASKTSTTIAQTTAPNSNNAQGVVAPFVPGILAALGAALL